MGLCINNDNFMHNKCYFLRNYRTQYCDDRVTMTTISEVSNSSSKIKKNIKKYKFVRFCKEIFEKDNFDKS